jgi:histidine ammonia-lyase
MLAGVGEAHDIESAEAQARAFESAVKSADMSRWLGRGTGDLYRRVREVVTPLLADRPLYDDIRNLARLLTR